MLTKKNALAYSILAYLIFEYDLTESFKISPYVNGREEGFYIAFGNKAIAFSENRKSDQIVLYRGWNGDFSMQGNVPNEEVHQYKKLFPRYDIDLAASCIYEWLIDRSSSDRS